MMRNLNSGLVAYWNFDEGSGNVLHDVSGHGNDGTIYGATWIRGVRGYALSFNGLDDYVVSLISSTWNGSFTVAVWVKTTNPYQDVFSSVFSSARSGPDWPEPEYPSHSDTFQIDVDGIGHYRFLSGTGGYPEYSTPIGKVKNNQWQFLTVTFDSIIIKTYMNGEYNSSVYWEGKGVFERYKIGLNRNEDCYFNGIIDEVRIYERALSPQEVKQLYEQYVLKPTNPGGNDGLGYLWLIIAGVVIVVVIVIALIMLGKKGGKYQPQSCYGYPPQYPPQPPQEDQQPPPYQQAGYPPPQGEFMNKPQPPPQSMGMITVTCPYCGFTLQISENMRGQWVQCPNCGNQFQVP